MQKIQDDFSDGFDMLSDDMSIKDNGYYYLVNARQRLGHVKPNKKAEEIVGCPVGKKQGSIAVGNTLIVFIAGKAYFNIDGYDYWTQIQDFSMSTTVNRYYSQAVPVGTTTYKRKLNADGNIASSIVKEFAFLIDGTPACILVQDGVNQPWVILQDTINRTFVARLAQEYDEWQNNGTNREYVPIGTQMAVVDSKLLIVAPDGKSVYHSVSGRYLDFMVNIDTNGDKLPTEEQGGAWSTSFAFDSATITCIAPANIPSSFIYGTDRNIRIITLDYTNTIFGEPVFYVSEIVTVGVINQDSIVDILGDYAIIDYEGVKSFNAVKLYKIEGRNSIFSLNLARLLAGKKQTRARCVMFDNYALFNLDTLWGNIIIVYDTVLQRWVSFDIIDGVNRIKQFAIVETITESKLYAITETDKLFRLYSSATREAGQIHTRSFVAQDGTTGLKDIFYSQKGEYLKTYFQDGSTDATVVVTEMVDGQYSNRVEKDLPANLAGLKFPLQFPIIFNSGQRAEPLTFNMKNGLKGQKIAYVIQWDSDANFHALKLETRDDMSAVAKKEAERVAAATY